MFRLFSRYLYLAIAFTFTCVLASAQILTPLESAIPDTTAPYSLFQYAAITGSGNSLSASYIPVVLANGSTIYKNLTIDFNVDSLGNLTITSGYPIVTTAQSPLASAFQSGTYVGPAVDTNYLITVAGASTVSGGATMWTLNTPNGSSSYTYPASASWYVGPLSTSPWASRLKAAGITNTAMSYGVGFGDSNNYYWNGNTLIGVSQVGNTVTFFSFTAGGTDYATSVDQITYTMKQ